MRMRLTVEAPERAPSDLELEAPAGATVRAVVSAIARHLHVNPATEVVAYSERKGAVLDGDLTLSLAGLASGDRLRLATLEESRRSEAFTLEIVNGPLAGQHLVVPAGTYVIGRTAPSDVLLPEPSVSVRHAEIRLSADACVITDLGSTNGVWVNGRRLREPYQWQPGTAVDFGESTLVLRRPQWSGSGARGVTAVLEASGDVPFNRPPRLVAPFTPPQLTLAAPPGDPPARRLPIGSSVLPLVMGAILYVITRTPTMLVFCMLGPAMAAYSYWDDRRSGRATFRARAGEFRREIAAAVERLDSARTNERQALLASMPSAVVLCERATRRLPNLWERRPGDDDFLRVRLGTADRQARSVATIAPGGSDRLRGEAETDLGTTALLESVPVSISLGDHPVTALTGSGRTALARWMVAQLATLHSPADVALTIVAPGSASWEWAAWLPHARMAPVDTAEDAERLATSMTTSEQPDGKALAIIVWDGQIGVPRSKVLPLLLPSPRRRVIWLEQDPQAVPGEAGLVVTAGDRSIDIDRVGTGTLIRGATVDEIDATTLDAIARALAPMRDVSGHDSQAAIPESVGLVEVLGLADELEQDIAERWRTSGTANSLILGSTGDGLLQIDFGRDGAHVLVGGTTGGGKSVLLQTAVASMAVNHPPSRVSFVLVDYKGTAAFGAVEGLPHTLAMVTDLRPQLTARALTSLRAELQRRKAVLDAAGCADLAELARRDPQRCPPRLVVVIDEFAALRSEVPEFLDGVLEVARQGRTLMVNLVLATQEPGEAITRGVSANVDVRIALRVADPELSRLIIDAPDAAWIPRSRPGRAVARLSPGQLAEFQVANSQAATGSMMARQQEIIVRDAGRDVTATRGTGPTDLERITAAIHRVVEAHRIPAPPPMWLPLLPDVLPLDKLEPAADDGHPVIGLLDEPSVQQQRPFVLELERGAVAVFGGPRMGKTTALRTVAASLAGVAPPDELHLYGLDFATRGLTPLLQLPHTAAIVNGEERDRVERLFVSLRQAIDERKIDFARHGVSTLAEYRSRTGDRTTHPRIVVLLDGLSGLQSTYERVDLGALIDSLPGLVSDGAPLGVHFLMTSERKLGLRTALDGLVTERIVLPLASQSDYADLHLAVPASVSPGRALVSGGNEVQVAIAGSEPEAPAQSDHLAQLGVALRARWPGLHAPALQVLDSLVEAASLPRPRQPLHAVLGIDGTAMAPAEVDLGDRHLLVVGPNRSGRSSALKRVAQSLAAAPSPPLLRLFAVRRSPLLDLDIWNGAHRGEACVDGLSRLADELDERPEDDSAPPVVVVVDDADELDQLVKATLGERVVRRSRDRGVRIVAAAETRSAHRAFGGMLAELRKDKHGLLLQPDLDVDGDLFGVRLPRRTGVVFPQGRGYLVVDGRIRLVQVGYDSAP